MLCRTDTPMVSKRKLPDATYLEELKRDDRKGSHSDTILHRSSQQKDVQTANLVAITVAKKLKARISSDDQLDDFQARA